MILIFDTSILVDLERIKKETIDRIRKLSKSYQSPAEITFMSYYEFLRGIKLKKPKNCEESIEFLNNFKVIRVTLKTAEILSDLKVKYDKLGISFSITDLMIASQVIENHGILVTRDKDFEKIEELNKIIL